MWYYYVAAAFVLFWAFVLRPKRNGSNIPIVTESNIVLFGFFKLPLIGVISEFLKSPNEMMKRCVQDYGPVFTIPVSSFFLSFFLKKICMSC